jgi:hypothetical protein
MHIRPAFLLCAILLAACLPTPQQSIVATPQSLNSGIEGTVTIGPACPVVQQNNPCPDKPYQATYTVLTTAGAKVTEFQTDEQGRFQISLAPGDYVLHLESPQPMRNIQDMPFNVAENKYTLLDIKYDSGIR